MIDLRGSGVFPGPWVHSGQNLVAASLLLPAEMLPGDAYGVDRNREGPHGTTLRQTRTRPAEGVCLSPRPNEPEALAFPCPTAKQANYLYSRV